MKKTFLILLSFFLALAITFAQNPPGNHGNVPPQGNPHDQHPGHPNGNVPPQGNPHDQHPEHPNGNVPPQGNPHGHHPGHPHGNVPPGYLTPPYLQPLPGQIPPPLMPGQITPPPGNPPFIAPTACSTQNYYNIKSAIAAQNFESGRLKVAIQLVPGAFLTAKQLASIAKLFNFDSYRLEFLKFSYRFCYNPQQYFLCERTLNFSSSRKELRDYINSMQ